MRGSTEQLVTYCACPAGARLRSSSDFRMPRVNAEQVARRLGMTPAKQKRIDRTCLNCAAQRPEDCGECRGVRILANGTNWRK